MAARRLNAVARRAQLLEMAREVFASDGYHGAAMEQIATRAGVTKPVLYQHFGGKKELYLALLELDMGALLAAVSTALAEARSNRERIARGIGAYFEFIDANEATFRLLFRETMGADPDFRAEIERFRDAVAGRIAEIISEETALPKEESELLARGVMGTGEAAAHWWLDRRPIPREDAIRILSELAWRGLAGQPRRGAAG